MMLVSQDGQKAIDSADVLAYYVYPFRADAEEYQLLAEPRRNYADDFFGTLILFRDKNLEVVKRVMRFLVRGIFFFPHGEAGEVIEVNLPDLYLHGMTKAGEYDGEHSEG